MCVVTTFSIMKTRRNHRNSTKDLGNWRKKNKKRVGRGKKSAKCWPPNFGPPFGPHPSCPPPPRFQGLGPPHFSSPTLRPPTLLPKLKPNCAQCVCPKPQAPDPLDTDPQPRTAPNFFRGLPPTPDRSTPYNPHPVGPSKKIKTGPKSAWA